MFSYYLSLEEINVSNFDAINIIDMSFMFNCCSSLKKLILSNFNTINVTNMSNMFFNCASLKELNIFNFNNNIIKIDGMFDKCSVNLKKLISNQNNNV